MKITLLLADFARVANGKLDVIAIRPIMNLTLTYDHRLVDGALAGRFLRDMRNRLETWDEANY